MEKCREVTTSRRTNRQLTALTSAREEELPVPVSRPSSPAASSQQQRESAPQPTAKAAAHTPLPGTPPASQATLAVRREPQRVERASAEILPSDTTAVRESPAS
jgi:hypothetical protein